MSGVWFNGKRLDDPAETFPLEPNLLPCPYCSARANMPCATDCRGKYRP